MYELAIVIAVAAGAIATMILGARALVARRTAREREAYEIRFARDLGVEAVVGFLRALSGLMAPWWRRPLAQPAVVFEVRADEQRIAYRLLVEHRSSGFVLSQLRAAIPSVRIVPDEEVPNGGALTLGGELATSRRWAPLRTDAAEGAVAAILATLQPLRRGELCVLQWVIIPATSHRELTRSPNPHPRDATSWIGRLSAALAGSSRPLDPVKVKAKQAEPLFAAAGRLAVRATTPERSRELLRRLTGAFHVMNTPGAHLHRRAIPTALAIRRTKDAAVPVISYPCHLNARELAILIGYPAGSPQLPGLTLGGARQLPASPKVASDGLVLAQATFPGAERPLAIRVPDVLSHVHVIGPTGVGKSTLLAHIAMAAIRLNMGLVVIDPKGDLIGDILDRLPEGSEDKVILLDPADNERPLGMNLLAGSDSPELVAENLVVIFKRWFTSWGPRLEDVLRAAILTLAADPSMTIAEIPVLLLDHRFRSRLVAQIDDPVALGPFWAAYEALSATEQATWTAPVQNKLRAMLLRRRIRNIVGQSESSFDFDEVLDDGKLLLVSLAKGLLGEDAAALLGSLVIARLWQAVQRRAGIPAVHRRPALAIADEFQDFVSLPTPIGDVLAQARGLGLGLVLAHQHLGQLNNELKAGVLANTRTKVVFQTSAADARTLAREFAPHLIAEDLQGLGSREVYAAVCVDGQTSPPASAATYPPVPVTGRGEIARQLSRERYGRDRDEVEAAIRARYARRDDETPGRRRRG